MNAERRKALDEIMQELGRHKEALEIIMSEEQEYFDNMPEGLQGSERGQQTEERIANMGEAQS